ncbi:MAG: hypothetical protein L5657_10905 [Calditerricola sp.]|jgi:hypothetical protein|nr:hypothetical protein [Bacillota bacterium]MCG0315138.1 hypothetical protein [Calditerricola sp.]
MDRKLLAKLEKGSILLYEDERVVGKFVCDARGICRLLPVTDPRGENGGRPTSAYAENCDLGWC